MGRRVRRERDHVSITISQLQIEQASRPSITAFTTMWADQNRPNTDKPDTAGNVDWATSAGFIACPLGRPAPRTPVPARNGRAGAAHLTAAPRARRRTLHKPQEVVPPATLHV